MKNKWTASLLQFITKGKLVGSELWIATTFTHDSRQTTPGQLYVAIQGETVDGHNYVDAAFSRGAVAALVSRIPRTPLPNNIPLLLVPNVEEALIKIGHYVRDHLTATVIAVTGSSGKTTTKDMLRLCLEKQGKTHANFRSFNSRWGVPLTLAECEGDEKYVVLEMGMSAPGEISLLTRMARPHIALITTINPAHLADLGSTANIARAKAEIFEGLPQNGTAIIPGDLEETSILFEKAEQQTDTVLLFGESPGCTFKLMSYEPKGGAAEVTISLGKDPYTYTLALLGKHFAMNSLAVLGAVSQAHARVPEAIQALETFEGSDRRGKVIRLRHNILLFDESYNANPGSMKAALEAFGSHPVKGHRYLVLGDMRALGKESRAYHMALKDTVLATQPHTIFTYGAEMKTLHDAIKTDVSSLHYENLGALVRDVVWNIKENDAIMIKASNSVKLNQVSEALMEKFKA